MGGSTRKNKVLCWFFLSTKHVRNMPKRKSTQKTVAFSCFPQKSVLVCNLWKPCWMKLETVYFSETISAEWQMVSRFPLYIYSRFNYWRKIKIVRNFYGGGNFCQNFFGDHRGINGAFWNWLQNSYICHDHFRIGRWFVIFN